jgi:Ca2+-binding RTX toxin-like protein
MEQNTMNMISTGTFLNGMDASDKQSALVKKLVSAWERKNSNSARAGGVSLMALSLAACGSSDDTSDSVSYTQTQLDAAKTGATAAALTGADNTVYATVDAAITSNDSAIKTGALTGTDSTVYTSVDAAVTSNDSAIKTGALTGTDSTVHASVDAAVTSNDSAIKTGALTGTDSTVYTSVDAAVTSNDAAAVSLAMRDAAAELGVTGTSTMTNAELVTAIKTANDAAVEAGVDKSTDDAAAINAAVTALGFAGITTLAQLNTAYDALVNPSTYELTTGTNSFTGTASANAFDASTSNSLNNGDVIDGGDGADTLNASFNGANVALNLTSIETLTVTNVTAASTLNMASVTGLSSIFNTSSTADVSFTNVQTIPTLTLNTNAVATTLELSNSALASASDSLTVNLQGVSNPGGANTGDVLITRSAGATNDLESITLNSTTVANSIETLGTGGVDTSTLKVTGDKNLTIEDALDADYTVVNAADFTGALSVSLSATGTTVTAGTGADTITLGTGIDNLTLGDGADTVNVTAASLAATDTISGGAGTDIVNITADSAITDAMFTLATSVETITNDGAKDLDITLGAKAAAAGVNTITLGASTAGDTDTIDVGAAFTNALTVNFDADVVTNAVTASAHTKALTVNAELSDMDIIASTVTAGTSSLDTLNISIDLTANADVSLVSNVEAINITDGNATTNHTTTLSLDDGNATYASATSFETLTVDATAIGASGDTVNINAAAEVDGKVIIKAGDGINTITLSGSTNFGDTITAGGGNDTIASASANLTLLDSIDGGDGTDTISMLSTANVVVDADFTLVTNVEGIKGGAATADLDLTLGALANAAGITTVTFADTVAGSGDTVTAGAAFTNALTVILDDATNVGNTVTATNYVGSGLTVQAAVADLAGNTNTITGSAGADVLNVTVAADATGIAQTGMTNVETIRVTDGDTATNNTATVTLANQNATFTDSSTYQTITVDLTAIGASGDTVNAIATAEADAKVVINGGAGVNTITMSASTNFGDTIDAGAGNDIISVATADLTSTDIVGGGDGTDTLFLSDDATVVDADFTLTTSVEKVTGGGATEDLDITLGAAAATAGITEVTFTQTGTAGDVVTVGAGFTNDLIVNLDADVAANSVVGTGYTKSLTVKALATELDTTASTLTGGSGSDTLSVTLVANDTLSLASMSAFETVSFIDDGDANADTVTIALAEAAVADGATLTIDGSSLTTDDIAIDLTLDTNGVNVVKGGSGVDSITGSASDLGDTLEGNAGVDTFSFATANFTSLDTVKGGAGNDVIKMVDASTVIDADFTNVTSVKELTFGTTGHAQTYTIGALAGAAGIDTITTGTGTNSVTISASNSATTVALAAGTDTVNAAAATTAVTVTIAETSLTAADTLTGGTASDTITLTSDGGTGDFTNVSGFETITMAADNATGITTADLNVASGKVLTLNSATLTSAALTFDGSAELDGNFAITAGGGGDHQITLGYGNDTYTSTSTAGEDVIATAGNNTISTGNGADSITGGTGADTLNGEAGADIFIFASANLTSSDTINGGDGNDVISMVDDATVVDADFTLASSIKTVTAAGTKNLTLTLGSEAAEAGIDTVTIVDSGASDSITVGAGFTNNLTVNLAADTTGADTVNATNYTKSLTVAADSSEVDLRTHVLTGGSGSDTLDITMTASDTLLLGSVTKFETIKISSDNATADTATLTTADALVASGATLTIDGSGLDKATNDATLTFDGSGETNGHFIVTTAGSGDHTVTLGSGNDSYTGSGSGATTVTATAGTNTITTGTGADTINAGSGTDTLTGGTGNDVFVFGSAANALNDSVTDFVSANDQISVTFDYSALLSGVVVNGVRVGTGVSGVSASEALLSGQRGEYVYDTAASKLYVNSTADASISGADVQVAVNAAATAANTIAAGDVQFSVTGTAFADTIVLGSGADTIVSGAGADLITPGSGADALTLTAGSVQTVKTTGSISATATNFDAITTFTTAEDIIHVDISDIEGLASVTDLVDLDGVSLGAGAMVLSGDLNLDLANGNGDDIAQFDTNFTNLANVSALLETTGTEATVADEALSAGDAFLALWDDGVDSYLAVVATTAGIAINADAAANDLTVTNIMRFVGLTNAATDFASADFVLIA